MENKKEKNILEKAIEERRRYQREYYQKNKEKRKAYNMQYWEKRAIDKEDKSID